MKNIFIDGHNSESATVTGVAQVLHGMRWKDLELLAAHIENFRGGGRAALQAKHLDKWAEMYLRDLAVKAREAKKQRDKVSTETQEFA